ncbi:hypothetical protein Ahy_A09g043082 [Arachis hypogaea]|uniref:Protein FAR1-RELATED SEQUENCE n=1 Tax=Arachis hypogaea TaxID=3818 RepID=A0A445BHG8_ARAHY|nr:hypothetical protein Ahy_A09g043082 [Arachis hypogaea]
MKEKNHNFFFELELGVDHPIKIAFWVDARSRASCEYFGDVISFDTIYNTNIVNHHGHSTLLGCALMKNEDIQSFKWLFEYWLRCMGEKAPMTFLPINVHRCKGLLRVVCPQPFTGGIPQKLNSYKRHEEIEQEMSHCLDVYVFCLFNRGANLLIFWCILFLIHILVYLDHHFWTRMRSTQRSESMHVFFNKFIMCNSSLIQFVKQYDNCLVIREQRERKSDCADFCSVILCAIKSSIEAQFQHVYTHEIQAQFRGKMNCITRSIHSALGFIAYEVVELISNSIFNKFEVTYDAVSREVKCQCLIFESRGILYRHSPSGL